MFSIRRSRGISMMATLALLMMAGSGTRDVLAQSDEETVTGGGCGQELHALWSNKDSSPTGGKATARVTGQGLTCRRVLVTAITTALSGPTSPRVTVTFNAPHRLLTRHAWQTWDAAWTGAAAPPATVSVASTANFSASFAEPALTLTTPSIQRILVR
ncbi:MAG: hypothetical protein HYY93_00950 [Planctomycetes bacterium]|nr:hypothetical protein [Planctomycetota bacterium]